MGIQTNAARNRYPGGRSFHEEDRDLFFGREADVNRFIGLIMIKQVIVLLGKSGSGKSSLINAGIIPQLQKSESYKHFIIRFNNFSEKDKTNRLLPSDTVIKRLAAPVEANINEELESAIEDKRSFWYWIKQNQSMTDKLGNKKFILFFEQFEELFTYPAEEIQHFSDQLAQLIYSPVPSSLRKEIDKLEKDDKISESLQDLIYKKPDIQLVFSIRSDRLSQMNVLTDLHPLILQHCYELEALSEDDAEKAITEPAKMTGDNFKTLPFSYDKGAIRKILKSVTDIEDQKIETAILQIVCRHVEEALVKDRQDVVITTDDLGDITNIFQDYYKNILDKFPIAEKEKVQNLIEEQLISDSRRNTLMGDYIKEKFHIPQTALDILEESSLLRKERFTRNRFMYEVGHDTIAAAVNKMAVSRIEKRKEVLLEQELVEQKELILKKRRSVRSLRAFLTVTVLLSLIASWFAFSYNQALNKINEDNKKSEAAHAYMESVFKNDAIAYAKRKILHGDEFLETRESKAEPLALKAYTEALQILVKYPHDTLYLQVRDKINQLKKKQHQK